jgi:hypothetical protein
MAEAIRGWWKRNDIALALLAGLFAAPLLTHALALSRSTRCTSKSSTTREQRAGSQVLPHLRRQHEG